MDDLEYAGFWIRAGAAVIDSMITAVLFAPFIVFGTQHWMDELFIQGGTGVLVSYMLPAAGVILFWTRKSATPGKMATHLTIVDAKTGGKPSTSQYIIRYLAYYVSVIPFFLGIFWIGFDGKKQGWHDKIAGTVVIRNRSTKEYGTAKQ